MSAWYKHRSSGCCGFDLSHSCTQIHFNSPLLVDLCLFMAFWLLNPSISSSLSHHLVGVWLIAAPMQNPFSLGPFLSPNKSNNFALPSDILLSILLCCFSLTSATTHSLSPFCTPLPQKAKPQCSSVCGEGLEKGGGRRSEICGECLQKETKDDKQKERDRLQKL